MGREEAWSAAHRQPWWVCTTSQLRKIRWPSACEQVEPQEFLQDYADNIWGWREQPPCMHSITVIMTSNAAEQFGKVEKGKTWSLRHTQKDLSYRRVTEGRRAKKWGAFMSNPFGLVEQILGEKLSGQLSYFKNGGQLVPRKTTWNGKLKDQLLGSSLKEIQEAVKGAWTASAVGTSCVPYILHQERHFYDSSGSCGKGWW